METLSTLLDLCEGDPSATGEFLSQRVNNVEPEQAVEQTVELLVIWKALVLMWHHCNDNMSI